MILEKKMDTYVSCELNGPKHGDVQLELWDENDSAIEFDTYWMEHLMEVENVESPDFAKTVFDKYKDCKSIVFLEIDPRNHHDEPECFGCWERDNIGKGLQSC